MTTKEYLKQIKTLDIKINQRIKELEDYKHTMYLPGGSDSERVQTSPKPDGIGERVAKACYMEEDINKMIDDFVDLKHKIIGEIQSLNNPLYINILYKRYVEYKFFEEIAVEMSYSYRQILRIHGIALSDFKKKCPPMSPEGVIQCYCRSF